MRPDQVKPVHPRLSSQRTKKSIRARRIWNSSSPFIPSNPCLSSHKQRASMIEKSHNEKLFHEPPQRATCSDRGRKSGVNAALVCPAGGDSVGMKVPDGVDDSNRSQRPGSEPVRGQRERAEDKLSTVGTRTGSEAENSGRAGEHRRSPTVIKLNSVEPDGARGKNQH